VGVDQKIKVCHIVSGDLWAGAEVQMYTIAQSLAADPEIDLYVVILNEKELAARLRELPIEIFIVDETRYSFRRIFEKASSYLTEKSIDILHSHRYKENILAAKLKKRLGIKHAVQTVHGASEPMKGIRKIKAELYSMANRYYTRRYFDKIIAVSADLMNQLKNIYPENKLVNIHNSVNQANLKINKNRANVFMEFGIENDAILIGTAGRMAPIKGYDIFLEAAKIIASKHSNARFLLVGDGPLLPNLKKRAAVLGLSDKVVFPGFRNDIPDILNALDIFVISSHHEGIPMIVLEAMALNLAVVSTAVGGIKEIIESDISGLLVEPGNPHALADCCIRLIGDLSLRRRIQEAAGKRIQAEYSADIQKQRLKKLYTQLMAKGA
jgi:glycosyltransferase involved in cell wall biosynthesis